MNAVHRQHSGLPTASLSHDRPFPAVLILFPIGAWSGSLVLDVASHAADQPEFLVRGALWLVSIGDVAALLAALAGLLSALTSPPRGGSGGAERIRMTAIVLATVAFIANLFWRYATYPDLHSPVGPLVLSAASLVLLCAAGWAAAALQRRHTAHVVASAAQARPTPGPSAVTIRAAADACHCERPRQSVDRRRVLVGPDTGSRRGSLLWPVRRAEPNS